MTAILDQPVVKRIPYIDSVTIGQLLDHSSGIYPTNNASAPISDLMYVGSSAISTNPTSC